MSPVEHAVATELRCVECGALSGDGRGWHADVATDDEDLDEPEVAVYGPLCWGREFDRGDGVPHARRKFSRG